MEWDIRHPNAPFVVKSPWLCEYLEEALAGGGIVIEHAFVPVRDLFSAAQSRREVTNRTNPADLPNNDDIPGGLWHTDTPEQQEQVLAVKLYKLIHTLAKQNIPLTLLDFPRIIHDPEYLYEKIAFVLKGVSLDSFRTVFAQVAQPQSVHNFNERLPQKGGSKELIRQSEVTFQLPAEQIERLNNLERLQSKNRQLVIVKEQLEIACRQQADEVKRLEAETGQLRAETGQLRAEAGQLRCVVESALHWQKSSWLKRAFHRWHPPGVNKA
jgi:hypothetical protein